ncbi:MAG: YdbL family protein [Pseudomonadota bacterium]
MIAPKQLKICGFLVIGLVLIVSSCVFAQRNIEEVKQSLKARNALIQQLKTSGVVGETNKGYLAFVGSSNGQDDVIAAENKDRMELHTIVAGMQNISISQVEQNMGLLLAKRANPGEYFQNASGAWQKK